MTVGVCWEFFEYAMDDIVRTDMQKDRVVQSFSSTWLDETKTNQSILVKDIEKTVLFDTQFCDWERNFSDVNLRITHFYCYISHKI